MRHDTDTLALQRESRLGAGELQKFFRQIAERLHLADDAQRSVLMRRTGQLRRQDLQLCLHGGDRRAQLMRAVHGELPLTHQRPLQAVQQSVHRCMDWHQLRRHRQFGNGGQVGTVSLADLPLQPDQRAHAVLYHPADQQPGHRQKE